MTRLSKAILTALPLLALAACEVNHMPMYTAQIHTVHMEATVTGDIEVEVIDPELIDYDGNMVPVVDPYQDSLVSRFVNRVGTRIVQTELGVTSVAVFQTEAANRLGWNTDPSLAYHDASFVIDVNDLEITIDDWGFPTLEVNVKVEGWFTANGELIYREYTDHQVPLLFAQELVEPWNASDINDVLDAREVNLRTLDTMPDAELRARVYTAIEDVSAIAAAELQRATLL